MVYVKTDTDHASPFQYMVETSSLDEMRTVKSQRLLRTGKERIRSKDGVRVQAVIEPQPDEPGYKSFAEGLEGESPSGGITISVQDDFNLGSYEYWVIATLRVSRAEREMAKREDRAIEPQWVKCIVNPNDFDSLREPLGRTARFIDSTQHIAEEEEE